MGLFAVLPLWLCYEALRLTLTPNERNGAEVLIADCLWLLGSTGLVIMRVLFAGLVIAAAVSIARRHIPWFRVTLVTALEGTVYALILGPVSAALAASTTRLLQAGRGEMVRPLVQDLVGSLGAGIFEELFFRLITMSVLALLFTRVALAFGLPKVAGLAVAVVLSALLFSLFHHVGPGAAPFTQGVFVFRTCAGLVLGVLFVVRGFGVCVYCHAMYDVHYYLTAT